MKSALFSVSYAGLWGQAYLPLSEFIAHAAHLGYEAVLLMGKRPHLSPLDTSAAQLVELKQRLAETGLTCLGTAAYTNFTANAAFQEIPLNEIQLLGLKRLCELTAELGGSQIRVFTGYSTRIFSPSEEWRLCVEALRECGQIAQAYGLQVGVQNHHDVALDSRALRLLLEEIDHPAVRASYDCWSPYLRGEDLYEGAKTMASRTINSICADYVVLPSFRYRPESVNYEAVTPSLVKAVPMGEGDLDYKAFLAGLKEGGYDGYLTYEMCSPLQGGGQRANLDRYAQKFLDYVKAYRR